MNFLFLPHHALIMCSISPPIAWLTANHSFPSAEIQAEDRGPATPQAHGVPGRGGAGRYHEEQGHVLDLTGGVSRERIEMPGETWNQPKIRFF